MRLNKRSWLSLLAMFAFVFASYGDALGRPKTRSSRPRPAAKRSAPKSKPRAKATPKRGTNTGKASNKGSWGSSKKKANASKPKKTKADQKAYDKAKANGTTFKTRKAASADFKKKNASKYPSKYTSKPTTRPGHIPQTTMVGGTQTTIIYNQGGGGYGYMNSLGTFMLYNAMTDLAMAPYYNRQMASAGYMYGPRPVVGMGGGMIVLMVLGGIVVIGVVGVMLKGKGV